MALWRDDEVTPYVHLIQREAAKFGVEITGLDFAVREGLPGQNDYRLYVVVTPAQFDEFKFAVPWNPETGTAPCRQIQNAIRPHLMAATG